MGQKRQTRQLFQNAQVAFGGVLVPDKYQTPEVTDLIKRVLNQRQSYLDTNARLTEENSTLRTERERLLAEKETNELTGLPNHIALFKKLSETLNDRRIAHKTFAKTVKRADLNGSEPLNLLPPLLEPHTVVFCDLNHFGQYNDRFSPDTTDGLVQKIAGLLQKNTRHERRRSKDFIARSKMAGDEFVILMDDTAEETAKHRMERIGKSIAEQRFLIETPAHKFFLVSNVTIAFGCYQLDSQLEEDQKYDTDYAQVMSKAHAIMKAEKIDMKSKHLTNICQTEVSGEELEALENDKSVIKVCAVTPRKSKTLS